MRRHIVVCSLFLAGVMAAPLFAQENVPPPAQAFASAPEIAFDSTPNFLKLPTGLYLGEAMGVARNSKGNVFVYTRSGEASRLFEFDSKGTFIREIGKGLYGFQMAHAIRVDPQDNIWVVDEGTDMVIKFTPGWARGHDHGQKGGIRRRPASDSAGKRSAASGHTVPVRQANRCGVGRGRKYLRGGWLYEFAGGEI